MNPEFFERLYRGYAAEHWIAGQLFERSFEAFRLPADFGLDLVVTNQFRVAQGITDNTEYFPFALQVKSRWLQPDDITSGPNERPQAEFYFQLKADELNLLSENNNSAVALVYYWPVRAPVHYLPKLILIHSRELPYMIKRGYLREAGSSYTLSVRHRERPITYRDQLVEELYKAGQISEEAALTLTKELPESFEKNWDARAYLQFARTSRSIDWPHLVWKVPGNVHTDFSKFPLFDGLQLD